jgi:hypothetical protein
LLVKVHPMMGGCLPLRAHGSPCPSKLIPWELLNSFLSEWIMWRWKALFIGFSCLGFTCHSGTIKLHRTTMSHRWPSWDDDTHRGTMPSVSFPKCCIFASLLRPSIVGRCYPSWDDDLCVFSSFLDLFRWIFNSYFSNKELQSSNSFCLIWS